jgi:hypothetical protein
MKERSDPVLITNANNWQSTDSSRRPAKAGTLHGGLFEMVSQDEIMDCVTKAQNPVSIKDIVTRLDISWNDTNRRLVAKKVESNCKFGILIKIQDGNRILITIKKEELKGKI